MTEDKDLPEGFGICVLWAAMALFGGIFVVSFLASLIGSAS